jgi:hypothetical protein
MASQNTASVAGASSKKSSGSIDLHRGPATSRTWQKRSSAHHVSSRSVREEGPPKQLKERTGKHYCVRCLAEVPEG